MKGGVPRQILSMTENKKGDVYIGLLSGFSPGFEETNRRMQEHRFSIHCSENSPEFNVIKQTYSIIGEGPHETTALTNAIKNNSGFANIFTIRCTSLDSEKYNIPKNGAAELIDIGCVNDFETLYVSVLVGGMDSPILIDRDLTDLQFIEIKTKLFKIILLWANTDIPPINVCETAVLITFDPKMFIGKENQDAAALKMVASSFRTCCEIIEFNITNLHRKQMEIVMGEYRKNSVADRKVIDFLFLRRNYGGLVTLFYREISMKDVLYGIDVNENCNFFKVY